LFFLSTTSYSEEQIFTISENSNIGFIYRVSILDIIGYFGVGKNKFKLDFQKPENSSVELYLDLNKSSAGFPLATKLMKGKSVLFAEKYPRIIFKSEKVSSFMEEFKIYGSLTIRDVSKKMTLFVKLDMENDSNLENSNELIFNIFSEIFRNEYGAGGYNNLVSNKIILKSKIILRRLNKPNMD
jgi:polyisoprenoid-binding protein YceI